MSGKNTGNPSTSPTPTVAPVIVTLVVMLVIDLNAFLPVCDCAPAEVVSTTVFPNSSLPVIVIFAALVHAATMLRGTSMMPALAPSSTNAVPTPVTVCERQTLFAAAATGLPRLIKCKPLESLGPAALHRSIGHPSRATRPAARSRRPPGVSCRLSR